MLRADDGASNLIRLFFVDFPKNALEVAGRAFFIEFKHYFSIQNAKNDIM